MAILQDNKKPENENGYNIRGKLRVEINNFEKNRNDERERIKTSVCK